MPIWALQYVSQVRRSVARQVQNAAPPGKQRVCGRCAEPRRRTGEGTLMAATVSRLRERYLTDVRKALIEKFGYKNVHQVPKLEKVVLNMSVGDAITNSKMLDVAAKELEAISGQKAVITKAKKSIAAFKLREGMQIAAKVTLRGDRMYVFLDKLFNIVLPRIRDFRGLPRKSFDGRGNYNLGLREQTVFPEINYDKVDKMRGMDIVIVTTAKNDEEAGEFLESDGPPVTKTGTQPVGSKLMAKTSSSRSRSSSRSSRCGSITVASSAAARAAICASSPCAGSASARTRIVASSPASRKRAGEMIMTDPIADMLTRIRNANTANHATRRHPGVEDEDSRSPQILDDEGFVSRRRRP